MFRCLNFKKIGNDTKAYFGKIPFQPDINIWFGVMFDAAEPYDLFLNDLFARIGKGTSTFLESGKVNFGFKLYNKEDFWDLGAVVDMFDKGDSMLLRVKEPIELDYFSTAYNLTKREKRAILDTIIEQLQNNANYVFDPQKAKVAIQNKLGITIDIPASINGLAPDYESIKDIVYNGSSVVYHFKEKQGIVKIKYSSVRDIDFRLAYKQLGMDANEIAKVEELYVWHHLDDFDPVTGEGTMQLVLKSLHNSSGYGNALNHTGGVAIWKFFYSITYR